MRTVKDYTGVKVNEKCPTCGLVKPKDFVYKVEEVYCDGCGKRVWEDFVSAYGLDEESTRELCELCEEKVLSWVACFHWKEVKEYIDNY